MVDLRNRRTRGLPLLAGFVNGALAYVAGLVGSFVLFVVFGLEPLARFAFALTGLSLFDGVGFAFYGGHFVPVSGGAESVNFALEFARHGIAYVLLVVAVLGGTGYYLGSAEWVGTGPLGFVVGATQVLGYLPLAALGAGLFRVELGSGTAAATTLSVPTVQAVVLAGVVFPVVVGGLGGALAGGS